jgi:diketogulonate reductase-like aldo/keto reductase
MAMNQNESQRRRFLKWTAGVAAGSLLGGLTVYGAAAPLLTRSIPKTGERLPVIGMGTWMTFDVAANPDAMAGRQQVLQAFFDFGGTVIDSSPMYGSAQSVLGELLKRTRGHERLFAATKVWTWGKALGIHQMERSRQFWGVPRFDLMQIHNLLDWEVHLETLLSMKSEGRIRYIGITTSHGRRHEEMLEIMRSKSIDFVQFSYDIGDREAEQKLLPMAAERGLAVVINRPFRHGELFESVRGKPLPAWAGEIDCTNWAQFFLKFIVSNPAVTCAIPATSQVAHMRENMGAAYGRLPDAAMRQRMLRHFESL